MIVTNLARHALYLRGSAHFVLTHLKSDLDLLGPHVESEEVRKLSSGLGEVVEATRTLRSEVEELKALALEVRVQCRGQRSSAGIMGPMKGSWF